MKTRDRTLIALMAATAFLACSEDEPTPVVEVNEAPAITLTSPAASAAYLPGSVVTIEWVATDDNGVVGVDLTYTADGGAPVAIASDLVGASYDWTVPNAATYGILIQATARDAE